MSFTSPALVAPLSPAVLLATLALVATLVPSVYSKSVVEPKDHAEADRPEVDDTHPWLKDLDGGGSSHGDYMEGIQADSPVVGGGGVAQQPFRAVGSGVCPPPREKVPAHFCHMATCEADGDCGRPSQRCCHNGCVATCRNTLSPPPLVDWLKEPPRRLLAGNSWLVSGPETPAVETCTTDFGADEDALLCPHGYTCHIVANGNPAEGIPNRGHCVKDADSQGGESQKRRFRLASTSAESSPEGRCVFEKAIFIHGARFMYDQHTCECRDGSITCTVGEKLS